MSQSKFVLGAVRNRGISWQIVSKHGIQIWLLDPPNLQNRCERQYFNNVALSSPKRWTSREKPRIHPTTADTAVVVTDADAERNQQEFKRKLLC